ncbi:MAG: response regulator [Calditrichaeota bacterium]|nr:response regulator [Calditrichota bacterium]
MTLETTSILRTVKAVVPSRILIVDDERPIGEFLTEFLTEKGYEVFFADNGPDALTLVKRIRPHVVLLDINMFGMNGLETLRRINEIDPRVGVLMVTAMREEEIGREALQLGAVDFITKPIDFDYLESSLLYKLSAMLE